MPIGTSSRGGETACRRLFFERVPPRWGFPFIPYRKPRPLAWAFEFRTFGAPGRQQTTETGNWELEDSRRPCGWPQRGLTR